MVHFVLFSHQKGENEKLIACLRERAALHGSQEWDCAAYRDADGAAQRLLQGDADLISWDMTDPAAVETLAGVRSECREAFLLAIAGQDTSPLHFLKPDIGPNSLALRPLEKEDLQRVAGEMLQSLRLREVSSEKSFLIAGREEYQRIRYRTICYFEARSKKIYLRLRGEEIGFAGTLDQLQKTLPKSFVRCHRSYIVNMGWVERFSLSENLLYLWEGFAIPVSRSFKNEIKRWSHELGI